MIEQLYTIVHNNGYTILSERYNSCSERLVNKAIHHGGACDLIHCIRMNNCI